MLEKALEVLKKLNENNYESYIVGGFVRDTLLERKTNDIDICTSATPKQILELFDNVIVSDMQYGSVVISHKGYSFDVTTFRKEIKYESNRKPVKIKYINDIKRDLLRRDFTINAIYLDPTTNQVIDPFDGIKDLFTFKVKFIGDPKERINEDPSRIIRGIRLAYKLNFSIEEKTNEAFIENIEQVKRLSNNRFNKEINKMIEELGEIKATNILKLYNIEKGEK